MNGKQELTEQLRTMVRRRIDDKRHPVSMLAISRESGVDKAVLSRWLHGDQDSLHSDTIDRLAAYLDVKLR